MLKGRYASGFLLSHLVKSCSERFLKESAAAEVEKFFSDNPLPGSERNVAQVQGGLVCTIASLIDQGIIDIVRMEMCLFVQSG